MTAPRDEPIDGIPESYDDFLAIVMHPAFRLGFLDAQGGKIPDHDRIMQRIARETPAGALHRIGWRAGCLDLRLDGDERSDTALAQYRYEEGRALCIEYGISCKAWGHPDYPPAQVRRYIESRTKAFSSPAAGVAT